MNHVFILMTFVGRFCLDNLFLKAHLGRELLCAQTHRLGKHNSLWTKKKDAFI